MDSQETQNETRPGDWNCKQCEHHNFARREVCRNCGCSKDGEKGKKTDWVCPLCSFNNYGRNKACIKCGHIHVPVTPPTLNQPLRPGDWVCTCGEMVFASRPACRRCGARKPTPAGYGGYAGYAGGYYPAGYSGYGLAASMSAPAAPVNQRPGMLYHLLTHNGKTKKN
eukprot:TRINITY_DN623_c0_g1_i6.p1 TRINITY_DN623_c0_g1~~TRINITY_DN623_c0_g1_i6.p1  ORF type:complete len:168 (+),score=12.25 TRINITY_DN623_c0_g1_i6:61-564(+)